MSRFRCLMTPLALLGLASCQAATPPDANDRAARGRDVPEPALVAIGQVQGSGPRSPMEGRQVSVQGVVVGSFAQGLGGVFLQSERDDGDPATAEGLFLERSPKDEPALRFGERLRVSGTVSEFGDGRATLTGLRDISVRVLGERDPAQMELRLTGAPDGAAGWERYEGMRLRITVPLTVSGNHNLTRQGELIASFDGRLVQPTELAAPGPEAAAIAADNARRTLLLDDNRLGKDPRSLWFLREPLSDRAPLRAGSLLEDVVGVLDQRRGDYRLQLAEPLRVRHASRPRAPGVTGERRIAAFNLLNLFNGDGAGGGFPTPRGAESAEHFAEQQRKLVASVQALQPDVAALMEVENDGPGADSALAQFVSALNAAGPVRDWRAIEPASRPGSDEIRTAIIYRSSRVRPVGAAAMLRGGPFEGRSRVPVAQAFRAGRGPAFAVVAVHLKSKGCGREQDQARGADADQRDGQGCWNPVRLESVRRLHAWASADPTGTGAPAMLLGDFNAYAMEDPMRWLREAGWRDAFAQAGGERPYSYVYDGQVGRLDHALLAPALAGRLRGAVEWHSNADESAAFGYQDEDDGDPWRASDHDPLLLGLDLAGPAP